MWIFFCKQRAAYDLRISDWSSDVCSSDLTGVVTDSIAPAQRNRPVRRTAADDSMRVTLSGGTFIDAGVVVFAAGERPRDELARDAGSPEQCRVRQARVRYSRSPW